MRAQLARRTHLYIVRTWTEERGEHLAELRGMVRELHSGETRYFRNWSELVAFVNYHLDQEKGGEPPYAESPRFPTD